ncbi:MAG: glycosyltransferase family 9 protein [Anaerolineaceae bacterium]|nr:glycosyltransferase family 9 protein [Betaproteobacteria bacterium]
MNATPNPPALKFLVIRRDNIGDLVCTTPVFRALREHYPDACICALVNSYTSSALENNPDINEVFVYTKAKHRPSGKTIPGVYWDRLRLLLQLRRQRFDYVILAGPAFQERMLWFTRMLKPKHIVGFIQEGKRGIRHIDIGMPYHPVPKPIHEVEDTFRLLAAIGIESPPPSLQIVANPAKISTVQQLIDQQQWPPDAFRLGIHISARKPSQRWPTSHFVALIRKLHQTHNAAFILFWSPGAETNPMHPGDDAKAKEIIDALPDIPVLAYPTHELGQLIAGLSLTQVVVCSDGGAMHLAAGLGKPILCFFGKSESMRWHPWKVPYVLLQPQSLDAKDISVEETCNGVEKLLS